MERERSVSAMRGSPICVFLMICFAADGGRGTGLVSVSRRHGSGMLCAVFLIEDSPFGEAGLTLVWIVETNDAAQLCMVEGCSLLRMGVCQVGIAEVGIAEVGVAEVGIAEVGVAEVGLHEVGPDEISLAESSVTEVGFDEGGVAEVSVAAVGLWKKRLDEPYMSQICVSQISVVQSNSRCVECVRVKCSALRC